MKQHHIKAKIIQKNESQTQLRFMSFCQGRHSFRIVKNFYLIKVNKVTLNQSVSSDPTQKEITSQAY